MAAKNDITGDEIKSRVNSNQYEENWERIFGKKDKTVLTSDEEKSKIDQMNTENTNE